MSSTAIKTNWLTWVLLALFLVSAPVPALVLCTLLFLSYRLTNNAHPFREYLAAIGRKINPTTLIIACIITLATIAISFQGATARYAGFPVTFVTYYNFPALQPQPFDLWRRLQPLSVNMLSLWVDAALYYCAIRLVSRLWKRVSCL